MKTIYIALITLVFSISIYSQQPQDSLFTIISGDTVHIWNTGAFENCACLFQMDVSIINDTIFVTEADTSTEWVFCLCYFDLCASVTGLQSGNYQVEVYRTFLNYPDTVFYIGSTSFIYSGSAAAFAANTYQSECYNITQSEDDEEPVNNFVLQQNYPNPFNPNTKINFLLPQQSFVTLRVYDVLGNMIEELINEQKPAGDYEIEFDASQLPSGVFFYRIQTENYIETRKMILLK